MDPQTHASAIKARLGGGATLGWPEAPPDDRARSHQPLVLLVVGGINGRPVLLSPLAIFAFPAAVLAAMSFSALFVCITTFMRKFEDFDIVVGIGVIPMFLFSGTFFPVSRVPLIPRIVIELLPLYHGTAMLRQLTTGAVDRTFALHVAYLVILRATAFAVAMRRLERALIK